MLCAGWLAATNGSVCCECRSCCLTIRSSRARFAVSDVPSRIARAGLTQALCPTHQTASNRSSVRTQKRSLAFMLASMNHFLFEIGVQKSGKNDNVPVRFFTLGTTSLPSQAATTVHLNVSWPVILNPWRPRFAFWRCARTSFAPVTCSTHYSARPSAHRSAKSRWRGWSVSFKPKRIGAHKRWHPQVGHNNSFKPSPLRGLGRSRVASGGPA